MKKEKLLEILLDKFFLALIVGLTVVIAGQRIREEFRSTERIRESAMAVSRVHSDLVTAERRHLMGAMGSYFQLLSELEGVGTAAGENATRLAQTRKEIETAVFQIEGLYPDFGRTSKPLLQVIRTTNRELIGKRRGPEEIEKDGRSVRDTYQTVLASLRTISVRAVEKDREAVEELLGAEDGF